MVSVYEPLARYLERQTEPEVSLRFARIEQILGRPLPPSARNHSAWWGNNDHQHTHARAWLETGWLTKHVDRVGETVSFIRAS